MAKVTLQGCITVPAEQLDAVKDVLIEHIKLTREEDGCIVFNVAQRWDAPLIFDVYEEYVSDEAFSAHQARAKDSRWAEVTVDAKRDYEIIRD